MATATTISRFEELLYALANLVLLNVDVARDSFEAIIEETLFAAGHADPTINHVRQLRVADALVELRERLGAVYVTEREEWITSARAVFALPKESPERRVATDKAVAVHRRVECWIALGKNIAEVRDLCQRGDAVRVLTPALLSVEEFRAMTGMRRCDPPKSKRLAN